MKYILIGVAFAACAWAPAVQASTMNLFLNATFTAEVSARSCRETIGDDDPESGLGNCATYDALSLGTEHQGRFMLNGAFEVDAAGLWSMIDGDVVCAIGHVECLVSESIVADFSGSDLNIRPFGTFLSRFVFDVPGGAGWHAWADGNAKGMFALRNVNLLVEMDEGREAPDSTAIPLPATLVLLVGAIAGLMRVGRQV